MNAAAPAQIAYILPLGKSFKGRDIDKIAADNLLEPITMTVTVKE